MNLAEALNAALPDLPAKKARVGYPRVDPGLIWHENTDAGEPIIVAMIRGRDSFFRFPPDQWKIIELFDGTRSWEDVAEVYAELYGTRFDPDDLREFTSGLDAINFWYKTPFEKNIALQQKLEEGRHKHSHKKSKWGDVAHMQFSAWDPDKYFNRIYPYLKWLYSRWFGMVCLALFGFMIYVFAANWGQIAQDSILFYNFTQKTAADLAEFWILFLILAFFHESSHGLTCKHYGGQVHAMGFHLIYLTPAFFVDVSEAFVYADRWQRFLIILAGIGVEMIFCALATIVWWGTPPGSPAHDLAYKIMLITGVAVVVVNMNPLIKLDGYYAFSEIIGFSDIKERSTAYLSGLVRKHVFRLPVEMDFVPRRRRPGYLVYAVLSGLYSYMLLITVLRFSNNVLSRFLPQWAFIPVLALGILIFRSRIKTLVRFLRTVYLDKRDRVRSWLSLPVMVTGAAILLALVFVPMWRETITARFLLEPARQAVVRSTVPGRVTAVLAREGEQVRAGDPLLTMTNADVDAALASAQEEVALTGGARERELLAHGAVGATAQEHMAAEKNSAIAGEESEQLEARAPIDGVVTATRLKDLAGSYLDAGMIITAVDDTRVMRALVYVPEFTVGRVQPGARVTLLVDGTFTPRQARVTEVETVAGDVPPAVETIKQIQGGARLNDYIADVLIVNDGALRGGMTGTARILVRRTSLAAIAARELRDFVDRKVW
ncbi:MAG TPA: HlyD family efflux transporter periplasmic adaptor subunit [Acidobacteriaceae bacterium]|jgi:putative peptide zinc metalloprotease protein|nr:HlyD family efflux transporter periplasmic adaptor subunit [Acidobacteriaceae bacterium]